MLAYRVRPEAEVPVSAGPVGCALMALLACISLGLIVVCCLIAAAVTSRSGGGRTILIVVTTTIACVGATGWLGARWWHDPATRGFAYGLWIGALPWLALLAGVAIESLP